MSLGPSRPVMTCLILALAGMACSLPGISSSPDAAATAVVGTLYALQTSASASQTALPRIAPASAAPPAASAASTQGAPPTPQQPIIVQTDLCWTGPGPAYPVVSSVKQGTVVVLLGVGSKPGWYVIENPKYHDRCWMEAKNFQIDPHMDLSRLKVFNPPPTPGPTPGPTSTP